MISPEAINLLKKLFMIDASKRPSAKEILCDSWLEENSATNIAKVVRSHSN
jgi:serine/threonine protein kinase